MKALILAIAFAAAVPFLRASETDGLFVVGDERKMPKYELKDGEFVLRLKAVRLNLTRAVFRFDTEDKTRYWLEIDIDRQGFRAIQTRETFTSSESRGRTTADSPLAADRRMAVGDGHWA